MNGVNLNANANAFSSNQTVESQIPPSDSPQLFDTINKPSEPALATSPDQIQPTDTLGVSASKSAVEQAIEDPSVTSAVPTAIEAPESDLRDATPPLAQVEPTPPVSQEQPKGPEQDTRDATSPSAQIESASLPSQDQIEPASFPLQEKPEAMDPIFGAPDEAVQDPVSEQPEAVDSIFGAPDKAIEDPVSEQPDLKIEANSPPAATPDQHDAFENLNIDNSTSNPTPTDPIPADLPLPQEDTKPSADDLDQDVMQIDQEPELKLESGSGMEDTNMADAPAIKVARERDEDDDMEEPSAKRAKTDDSFPNNQLDGSSASFANGDDAPPPQAQATTITERQAQELVKTLRNMASRGGGKNFRAPVEELWPGLAGYSSVVSNPIDLRTMQEKLTRGDYHTMEDVKADARLLHDNAVAFNGPVHVVTKAAEELRKSIESKVNNLSAPPSGAKKDKKKRPSQNASGAARAPASSSRGNSHRPPPNNSYDESADIDDAPTSYAIAAGGVPQARRGSVMDRPKREIVPPKNKDMPYSVRPKNKKFAAELRFCEEILAELNKQKHSSYVSPFMKPVDPVALGIPSYFSIIKRPMDISTITRKLKEGSYSNAADFDKDMRLMLANCFKFNPAGNIVNAWGREVESIYDEEWSRKDQYMARHAPAAASPPSAQDSEEEDEDEGEGEEVTDHAGAAVIEATRTRLVEEQSKLIKMMSEKVGAHLIEMQQSMVEIVQKSLSEAEASAKKKTTKKPKTSKPIKKAVPIKRQGGPVKKAAKISRYMGTLEKETISNGLGALPDNLTTQVLEWIQNDQEGLAVSFYIPLS